MFSLLLKESENINFADFLLKKTKKKQKKIYETFAAFARFPRRRILSIYIIIVCILSSME